MFVPHHLASRVSFTPSCHWTQGCEFALPVGSVVPLPCRVAQGCHWPAVHPALRQGVALACGIRQRLAAELGFTVSVGVAPNKLLARLVGPLNKPDCVTVLPAAAAQPFIRQQAIKSIPHLRQKLGTQVGSQDLSLGFGISFIRQASLEAPADPFHTRGGSSAQGQQYFRKIIVYLVYLPHFNLIDNPNSKLCVNYRADICSR